MKQKFAYLVYCNSEPIIYAVYSSKKRAMNYALSLVKWREDKAKEKGWAFGRYHEHFESKRETEHDAREKTIYTTCLMIKDGLEYTDDGCYVQVVRRPLL